MLPTDAPPPQLETSASRCQRLLAALGDPHRHLQVVHIAGTNGKGSTAAMIESACRQAGLRTGLTTSPHLYRPGERIRLDGQPVATAPLVDLVQKEVLPAAATIGLVPTEFEVYTAAAMVAFARHRADVAVVEAGVGGKYDATNVFADPLVCLITTIGWDHMAQLGDSLRDIAASKAAIIRAGRPVITGADGEALAVIREQAEACHAPVTAAMAARALDWSQQGQRLQFVSGSGSELDGDYAIPLLGEHQLLNAAMALHALDHLGRTLPLPVEAVRRGLAAVNWPGRMELANALGASWLLDGAHNGEGAAALAACLRRHFPDIGVGLIFGALADKPWRAMVDSLHHQAERVWLTPVPNDRSESPDTLATADWGTPVQVTASYPDALFQAWQWASQQTQPKLLVVAGSLSLVGASREYLGLDDL